MVTTGMKGYFKFDLMASDDDNIHQTNATIKIVIISADDSWTITFVNVLGDVQSKETNVQRTFDSVFPNWIFVIDRYQEQARVS